MLWLLSYLYGKVIGLRNAAYDRGVFETHDLGARTVSIGNITAGGTGKTPIVAYVADLLAKRGERVCILTRGYGREDPDSRILVSDGESILETDPKKAGDEPLELANKLEGRAVIMADPDRVAAAEWARRKFGVSVFVLDDGFQHRKAGRNVDIVCMDATDPFGGKQMIPAGRLREPLGNLSRATAIVITRAELVSEQDLAGLKAELSKLAVHAIPFECRTQFVGSMPTRTGSVSQLERGSKVFAFCGIGNPDSFFSMLRTEGFDVRGTRSFRDHHAYSQSDVGALVDKARACDADALMTTHKDGVKMNKLELSIPCYVALTDVVIDNADEFANLL